MTRVATLFGSTIGRKFVVAVTGLILLLFVLGHMAGNLKIFQGSEKFDHYARFLREVGSPLVPYGALLWIVRAVLLVALVLHIVCITQLSVASRRARDVHYHRANDLSFSFASRTLLWGGIVILGFVTYHLMHLTWGLVHPSFDHASPYHNVVTGFRAPWVVILYAVALLALGLHLYHGLWSTTQTLAMRWPLVHRWRRPVSGVVAVVLVIGYLLVPVAVAAGWLRLP
jgi:succinate dehydrogenase / fumarate reductase cytochrome b subunit